MTCPPLMGLARLTRRVYHETDVQSLNDDLLARLQANEDDAHAWLDLSLLATLRFQHELARSARHVALSLQNRYTLDSEQPAQMSLLAVLAPGDLMANTPLEFLLEHSAITLHLLYLRTIDDLCEPLPAHDVLFVAVGESDQNRPLLEALAERLRDWPKPVINRPEYILETSRDRACALLADIPGVLIPETACLHRSLLPRLMEDLTQVLIVRPIDSHAGHHLEKLSRISDVQDYLEEVPDEWFYVSSFIDYSGTDGRFRKYRIVLLGEQSYAGHLAISEHWMVHYLNAGMTESAEKRAEEARFMACFDTDFAVRHAQALADILHRTRLDYLILDCAELADGTLLIFEIDTSAVLHDMDDAEHFAYKHKPMNTLFTAFQGFLLAKAAF
ncbi:MAG: ATP-grasp domain-containing protein [Methylococcaceae bacterium]